MVVGNGGNGGAGGGGASDIRLNGDTLENRILVAGGGGGGGQFCGNGGSGGGSTGGNGTDDQNGSRLGFGGTQIAGGKSQLYEGTTIRNATFGLGGEASGGSFEAAGGGGGWYGGGHAGPRGGGGGGSGYIEGVTNGKTTAGKNSGNGKARITLIE